MSIVGSALEQDVAEILIDEVALRAKVAELGGRITDDYRDRQVTLVSVLKGALPFMADLMRAIALPVRIDLMEVSSYGSATEIVRPGPHPQGPLGVDRGT